MRNVRKKWVQDKQNYLQNKESKRQGLWYISVGMVLPNRSVEHNVAAFQSSPLLNTGRED